MKVLVVGYIRPELDYTSRGQYQSFSAEHRLNVTTTEALIEDINTDKQVALNSLARPGYEKFQSDRYFDPR